MTAAAAFEPEPDAPGYHTLAMRATYRELLKLTEYGAESATVEELLHELVAHSLSVGMGMGLNNAADILEDPAHQTFSPIVFGEACRTSAAFFESVDAPATFPAE